MNNVLDEQVGKDARASAKTAGAKTYLGKPCAHHPEDTVRYVSNGTCRACIRGRIKPYRDRNKVGLVERRKAWDRSNPVKAMLQRARRRAKELDREFSLQPSDIVIPDTCPVLGIHLVRSSGQQDNAPSLDRVDNDRGYVPGNVLVVSFRANRIKGNSTINELRKVVDFYEHHVCKSN